MGIVLKQSFQNTVTIYAAFAIGGVNALFLYTSFLEDDYYGLVTFLLSTANILMPLTAFGVQYTILKFFSSYKTKEEKDTFLSMALWLPLVIAIPFAIIGTIFYESISAYLSLENPIVENYTFVIYLVAVATAYFEIFYAWAKVQMQSVYGNILKEMFSRIASMVLLFAVYLKFISVEEFIYYLTGAYFIRALFMFQYAMKMYRVTFVFQLPKNFNEIIKYSLYIILAGAASTILIDIDKFMIPQKEAIANTAYYAVAVYIGSVVETPGRAMAQIMQPLVAKALNEKNMAEVKNLYKKSSINLFLVSGLVFLLINANIEQMYLLLPSKYTGGVWVVLYISIAKLYHMLLGANGAIITNSQYYKVLLPYGIAMAISVIVLNNYMIDWMSINGAALSTLIVVLVFNTIKLFYVKSKFNLSPFSNKTIQLLLFLIACYFSLIFWNFEFHPIINIFLKSVVTVVFYLFFVYKLKISEDINTVLIKTLKYFN
jgi:O-antigen/teichoic acid export membrane protein